MEIHYKNKGFFTEKDLALSVIGGRWKIAIIWCLLQKSPLRLNELEKMLPHVNQRMLIRQLRELEGDFLIIRNASEGSRLKVEYQLSDIGKSLEPVVSAICDWGNQFNTYIKEGVSP